jgi:hypothetical protein
MDIHRIQDSVHMDRLANHIGIRTKAGLAALKEKTETWVSDPKRLRQRSYEFATLQSSLLSVPSLDKQLAQEFTALERLEPELDALVEKASDLETEAFNELLFLKSWTQPFNFMPLVLFLWSVLRVYIFPGMAMLMPILMLILPFIIVRIILGVPITLGRYTMLLSALFSGNLSSILDPNFIHSEEAQKSKSQPFDIFQLFKGGLLAVTVAQSFLQPYWTYQHLSSIDAIIQQKAAALNEFKTIYERIQGALKVAGYSLSPCPFATDITDPRQLVAAAHLHPVFLKTARRKLGALEALFCLANRAEFTPVHWLSDRSSTIVLQEAYDYRVDRQSRVAFDLTMNKGSHHALLTGPNRGGKSTTLRGLLTCMLLAHTYGCVTAAYAALTPFQSVYVCLTPEDLPGKKSRFEREIEFTAATLRVPESERSLVLLDELYHSTNPPDASKACEIYTEQLWKRTNTVSIISTHLFDFVEGAPATIQRLCCPATVEGTAIHYTYRLGTGVCRVSSVQELLVENGLI